MLADVWQRRLQTIGDFSGAEWPTELIEFGAITESISASGTIQTKDQMTIGCECTGRVTNVFVDAGQAVKAGDVLCQLDDRLANLRLQQAKLAI